MPLEDLCYAALQGFDALMLRQCTRVILDLNIVNNIEH